MFAFALSSIGLGETSVPSDTSSKIIPISFPLKTWVAIAGFLIAHTFVVGWFVRGEIAKRDSIDASQDNAIATVASNVAALDQRMNSQLDAIRDALASQNTRTEGMQNSITSVERSITTWMLTTSAELGAIRGKIEMISIQARNAHSGLLPNDPANK